MPSINELANVMTLDPLMYQQAMQQIGVGNQAAQQGLDSGAQDLQAKTLANMFSQQANPLKLQGMQQDLEGGVFSNQIKGVQARNALALEPEEREAKRAHMLSQMDEDALKSLTAKGESLSIRGAAEGDDTMEARGKRMMEAGRKEMESRYKGQVALDKATAAAQSKLEGIQYGADAATQRSAASDASRERVALTRAQKSSSKATDILANVASGKLGYEKAATAFETMSAMEDDPGLAEKYSKLAITFANARDKDVDKMSGKPDLAAMGIEVNQFKTPLGTSAGMGARPAAAPTQGSGPTNSTESGMARDLAPLLAKVNSPEEIQGEIQATTAMLPSLSGKDRAQAEQYIAGLKQKLGGGSKAAAPMSSLPPGSKQIGTSGGKPVYQTPDGKQFLGK